MLSICLLLFSAFISQSRALTNLKVTREIDARSHVVKVVHNIVIDDDTATSYKFAIEKEDIPKLAHIDAKVKRGKLTLKIKSSPNDESIRVISTEDGAPMPSAFSVTCIYTHKLEPKPATKKQADPQLVKLTTSPTYYSSYRTKWQVTHIKLPNEQVLSYSKQPAPVAKESDVLTYGPYEDIDLYHNSQLNVHYECSAPFLTVVEMTRLIEVSHWGNIAIEETFDIKNTGPALKGSFSRLDYDLGIGKRSTVAEIITNLPGAAKDIYYRDEIGNISTSALLDTRDSVQMTLNPRFPIVGGWKTHYTIGYNVPAYEFLQHDGLDFALKMRLLDHVYDDQVIDKLTVKIVLPELSSQMQISPPFPISYSSETLKTYLDIGGRPVLVLYASNLASEHIKDFTLHYKFNRLVMLREPLMLVTAYALIFICAMIYVRLDFAINQDEKSELHMQAQALVDEVSELQKKRFSLYRSYEDAITQFKANKDTDKLSADRQRLERDHKQVNKLISTLQSKLAPLYPHGADKVTELTNLDQRYRDMLQENVQLADRLVSGKINKAQYQVSDNEAGCTKSNAIAKMESILESL